MLGGDTIMERGLDNREREEEENEDEEEEASEAERRRQDEDRRRKRWESDRESAKEVFFFNATKQAFVRFDASLHPNPRPRETPYEDMMDQRTKDALRCIIMNVHKFDWLEERLLVSTEEDSNFRRVVQCPFDPWNSAWREAASTANPHGLPKNWKPPPSFAPSPPVTELDSSIRYYWKIELCQPLGSYHDLKALKEHCVKMEQRERCRGHNLLRYFFEEVDKKKSEFNRQWPLERPS